MNENDPVHPIEGFGLERQQAYDVWRRRKVFRFASEGKDGYSSLHAMALQCLADADRSGEKMELMKPVEGSALIGKSVQIKGELSGSEDLFMDGKVEGTVILTDSRLTVGPNGVLTADVTVRDLIVFGLVKGNVSATGTIELRRSAVLQGDIVASRLSIEEDATIQGRVELTGEAPKTADLAG
jgi:cytoskeletal protein CcmA (bactofilin family)